MAIRIALLSLTLLLVELASAKTVYMLVFTDDHDASIGSSCEQTHLYISNTFIPDLKRYTNLPVVENFYNGSRFTVANLNGALSSLSTNVSDVIIFYYAGHGYNRGQNDYPTLTLGVSGTPIAQRSKDLLSVYNTLRNKPHQLLLCIAEACNAVHRVNGIADNMITSFPTHVFSTNHFRELFHAKGDYLVSSSVKGQKSYSADGSPGMFTCGFKEAFNEMVEESFAGISTWSSVFSKTRSNTEHIAMESGYEQTPQFTMGVYVQESFSINGMTPEGLDENSKAISSSLIYAADIARLGFRLNYTSTKDVTITYRLSKDGIVYKNESSPDGYTWTVKLPAGTNKSVSHNWGWSTKGNYKYGDYKYEIFKEGKLIYSKSFSLSRKYGETSYLTVDKKTAVSTSFPYNGGSQIFYVNTDGDSYTIDNLPSWCYVSQKNNTSFTLQCKPTTSSSLRTDWFRVKSGDKTVKIDISQLANTNIITGSIDKIWVEHNVIQYVGLLPQKGMKIHVKFTVNNMLNKTGNIAAFFNFQNGTKLMDYNMAYRALDGQVTVQGSFTPNYTNCVFNDYQLFMPYNELHCSQGTSYLKFNIEISEKTTGSWKLIQSSSAENFTYTGF